MIGLLRGVLFEKSSHSMIVDVMGVGYLVFCTNKLLEGFKTGDSVEIFVSTYVKENEISLFGFTSSKEKSAFVYLQSVPGVGPRMAMAILNTLTVNSIDEAVEAGDVNAFCKAGGVGRKMATRIIQELKGKLTTSEDLESSDLVLALMKLGYKKQEISKVLNKIPPNQSLEERIKEALRAIKS